MRRDRRRSEGESVSRQDATDAGTRTLYRAIQAGNGNRTTCRQVRRQLAAYRRDDWPATDIPAVTAHLGICAECRRAGAEYRLSGELLRQLPTITPPHDFRDRVFAAIRADQLRYSPDAFLLSEAPTLPSLPTVHLPRPPYSLRSGRVGVRYALLPPPRSSACSSSPIWRLPVGYPSPASPPHT